MVKPSPRGQSRNHPPLLRDMASRPASNRRFRQPLSLALATLVTLQWPLASLAQDLPSAPVTGTHISTEQSGLPSATAMTNLAGASLADPLSTLLQAGTEPTRRRHTLGPYQDAWITDVGTQLYGDTDNDGYHSSLSLTIDADTSREFTEVYLVIDIQRPPGLRERLLVSNDFSIYGNSVSDEYRIDFDLLNDYPAGSYDLYIELYDAYTQNYLDNIGAGDFSNLSRLPLESEDQDYSYDPSPYQPAPYQPHYPPANDDIHVTEYAGSSGLLTTSFLGLALLFYRRRHYQAANQAD